MSISKATILAAAGFAASLSGAGCCTEEKQQIELLYSDKNELLEENQRLQNQLAQAAERERELLGEIDRNETELTRLNQNVEQLKDKLAKPQATPAPRPVPSATPQGWERGQTADRITVGSDILFASGRATLTQRGKQKVQAIARDLLTIYLGMPVRVYGYTDSDPIRRTKKLWKDNLDLSANRAAAVTRYLIESGVPAEDIETIAMGPAHPVADNSTRAGKAKNRRVEILVVKAAGK